MSYVTALEKTIDPTNRNHYNATPQLLERYWRIIMKRPFQPNSRKRKKTHGFLVRMRTVGGKRVLNARRRKGRHKIAV